MIIISNLRHVILSIDSLEIPSGITSVIGPNGSGKTSLLKILSGITEPDCGSILIDGLPPRKKEIGWVNEFPDRNILFGTPYDEIASPLRFRHLPCREVDRRVRDCGGALGITGLLTRRMKTLSGGEKVLVALAAALVINPDVLVLDEYDSHVDAHCSERVRDLLSSHGVPYVIRCTQQMERAARSDELIYLENGRVAHKGKPADIFDSLADSAFYPLSWRCR